MQLRRWKLRLLNADLKLRGTNVPSNSRQCKSAVIPCLPFRSFLVHVLVSNLDINTAANDRKRTRYVEKIETH